MTEDPEDGIPTLGPYELQYIAWTLAIAWALAVSIGLALRFTSS